jgi:hypothetical protein
MHDQDEYQKLVSSKSEAIYKEFFKLLKGFTSDNESALKKMFITGVSPLAMYDVTSGSNIGKNITNVKMFNDMVGITQDELKKIFKDYDLNLDNKTKETLDFWYNSYKFNINIPYTIYNTDMILYYVSALVLEDEPPQNLIDLNVRMGYSKLRYLVYTDKKLNGNFSNIQKLFGDGYITANELKDSFSSLEVKQNDNFISLLYYLGLLTLDCMQDGEYKLKIPNQTIKRIMAEYIQKAYSETKLLDIQVDGFKKTLNSFAYHNKLDMFHFLSNEINKNSSIRDYIQGESFTKGFFSAYLTLSPYFITLTEVERNKGFVDIYLKKSPNIKDDINEALIELKYIKRSEFTQEKLDQTITQAKEQLTQYNPKNNEKGIIVVFNGWEMVYCEFY